MTSKLAIEGGAPVRKEVLPYARHTIQAGDVEAVARVLRSDWLTTGPVVDELEAGFASAVGSAHGVAVSSGTAALHLACCAAGVGPGDEVITTPMTFVATANAVLLQGARPVFADVERDTLNISPALVAEAFTERTRAILPVDYAGQPVDMEPLIRLAKEKDLILIEDAAHALGAEYRASPVGALADMTTFSLHPAKHVTGGEGGVITTGDEGLARRLRIARNHGIEQDLHTRDRQGTWFYEVTSLACNYRLSDIQAALALSQLRMRHEWLERRRSIARAYGAALAGMVEVELPMILQGRCSAWHIYVIRLCLDRLKVGRAEVFEAMRAENIGVNVHYIPVPWHPLYRDLGYEKGECPVAEEEYERLLTLPLWPGMNDRDVQDVIDALCKVVDAYRA